MMHAVGRPPYKLGAVRALSYENDPPENFRKLRIHDDHTVGNDPQVPQSYDRKNQHRRNE
jgi:hypothetical protein